MSDIMRKFSKGELIVYPVITPTNYYHVYYNKKRLQLDCFMSNEIRAFHFTGCTKTVRTVQK